MFPNVAIGSPRGVDGDLASELSQLTPCSGMPGHGNGGSDFVVTDGDIRCVSEYLDEMKARGGTNNRRCRILLRSLAEEIRDEKDDEDCLNRQAHHNLIAEEMAARDEAMAEAHARRTRWRETAMIVAEEVMREEELESRRDRLMMQAHEELLAEELAERETALAQAEGEEEARRMEQERIFAEEYKGEDLEAPSDWMLQDEVLAELRAVQQEQDEVLAELQLIEQEEQDEALAESGAEEAYQREQERIFVQHEQDEVLAELKEAYQREQERIFVQQEQDEVLAEIQLIEQEEQDEALAESGAEEAYQREQERIYAEENMDEIVDVRDRLHQQAHYALIKEEIAEQDEVMAEQDLREQLYEHEQERLIAEEGFARRVALEPHERRALLAEISYWPALDHRNFLDTLRTRLARRF